MKIDRVDVSHDEIAERCDEYIVISCEFPDTEDDNYISRVNVNTDGEVLKEILVDTMLDSKKFASFVQQVVKEYNKQKRGI